MRTLICVAMVILGGCTTMDWAKQGASGQDLEKAKDQCTAESSAAFPPKLVTMGPNYSAPQSVCEGQGPGRTCRQMPATYLGEKMKDQNDPKRNKAFDDCMGAGGWRKG